VQRGESFGFRTSQMFGGTHLKVVIIARADLATLPCDARNNARVWLDWPTLHLPRQRVILRIFRIRDMWR